MGTGENILKDILPENLGKGCKKQELMQHFLKAKERTLQQDAE